MGASSTAGAAVLALALAFAAVAQTPDAANPATISYARPDMRVPLPGGRRMHIRCLGVGSPTIILTPGLGDWGYTWRKVQGRLAQGQKVCAWDRAGSGFSDPSGERQDVRNTTRDLERLLKRAGIGPPYVLVGHSIGSFETLMFAYRHPEQLAGIVLVDPSSPFQYRRFEAVAPHAFDHIEDAMQENVADLRECIARVEARSAHKHGARDSCLSDMHSEYPPDLRAALEKVSLNVGGARNLLSLSSTMDKSSRQLEAARRSLGDTPLIVLTAGRGLDLPENLDEQAPLIAAEWRRLHAELAAVSTAGQTRVIEDAEHYIQEERPDAVIAAVEEVVGGRH